MSRTYRVIVAKTEPAVEAEALEFGLTILRPIREFEGLDSLHDKELGDNIGRIFTKGTGFVALAYREL